MKLLLCISSANQLQPFLCNGEVISVPNSNLPFLSSIKLLHHDIDILETGVGIYQTTYKLTKVLSKQKYHLAIKLSLGNAYKPDYEVGSVLNIVNEKPGDYGIIQNGEWKDYYDLNLLNREDAPQVRGGYINLTNAYMNVFLPFKKSVGVTVNHYADKETFQMRREKYKADAETADGLGFVYPCLYERQNFYHLCFIERNLATGQENMHLAAAQLNSTLHQLIQLL